MTSVLCYSAESLIAAHALTVPTRTADSTS
jgi:hypothetical protein